MLLCYNQMRITRRKFLGSATASVAAASLNGCCTLPQTQIPPDNNPPALFDLHCHPSLKYSIWKNATFYTSHQPLKGQCGYIDPLGIYYDAPGAKKGGVKVLINFHYVPENGFLKGKVLEIFEKVAAPGLIENPDETTPAGQPAPNSSAWEKLQQSIARLNEIVAQTNKKLSPNAVTILDNPKNLERATQQYDLVVINSLEGAHHLGRNLERPSHYCERLQQLKNAGFCAFTLSHFFLNDICDSAGGIPESDYPVTAYKIPIPEQPGLTSIGKEVVSYALSNGILVDLVHSTRATRQGVYGINRRLFTSGKIPKLTPLAFTHTGIRPLYRTGKNATYESLDYLPDNEDIDVITETKGIMGIILMKCWLNGVDDDKPILVNNSNPVFDTIDYLRNRMGTYRPHRHRH